MRDLAFQVELDGTAEEVWRLLTEGEGITRWFAPEARVTPGVGGTVWLSWGPGMEGEASITGWESGQRFQWTERSGRGRAGRRVFRMQMGERDRGEWQAATLRALSFTREAGGISLRLGEELAFRGEVLFERAPGYLIVTLGESGVFALFFETCGGTTALTSSWMLRGEAVGLAEEIGEAWGARY